MMDGSMGFYRQVDHVNTFRVPEVTRSIVGSSRRLSTLFAKPATLGMLVLALLFPGLSGESCAHTWMAPKKEAARENPKVADPESVAVGRGLFAEQCAYCHGEGAEGLPAGKTGLEMDTPNLLMSLKSHPEGDLHWKIRTGKGEMPKFGDELSDGEIWDIINYLNKLQQ